MTPRPRSAGRSVGWRRPRVPGSLVGVDIRRTPKGSRDLRRTPRAPPRRPAVFPTTTAAEDTFVGRLLRQETVGGAVVLVAAVVAVIWANSPVGRRLRRRCGTSQLGPLDLEHWAADGALTLFFFLAGLELKREFLVGSLSKPADALVPDRRGRLRACSPRPLVYVGGQRVVRARGRHAGGLGDPGRDRHRLRPRGARGRRQRPARPAAGVPADAGGGRRPRRHRDHRGLLHLRARTSSRCSLAVAAARRLRLAAAGPRRVVALVRPAGASPSGGSPTRAASTPRSPAWRWGC